MAKKEQKQFLALPCIPVKDFPDGVPDLSLAIKLPCEYCQQDMWIGPKKYDAYVKAKYLQKQYYFGCYRCFPKYVDMNEFGEFNILQYPGN
jgi:hypothetical protein